MVFTAALRSRDGQGREWVLAKLTQSVAGFLLGSTPTPPAPCCPSLCRNGNAAGVEKKEREEEKGKKKKKDEWESYGL